MSDRKRIKFNFFSMPTEGIIFCVLILMCIILTMLKPAFASGYNLSTLIRTISWTTIVAFGQTLVLLTGGIDLSVAGIAGMSGVVSAYLIVNTNINPYICIILVIAVAFFCGCINGILIAKMNMVPFIVTLATGSIFTGFIYVITKGSPILGIPENVMVIGRGMLFGVIPYPAIIMILGCIILGYVTGYTPFGRYIYSVGGNKKAAEIAGIKCDRVIIRSYALCSLMASVAGILITCRLGTAQPTIGADWVMPSVTAACIGGTSLAGGRGKIIGALVGGVFMGVISNAITILAISTYWELVITGFVILIAIAIDRLKALRNHEI